jgi:hypothetical protein
MARNAAAAAEVRRKRAEMDVTYNTTRQITSQAETMVSSAEKAKGDALQRAADQRKRAEADLAVFSRDTDAAESATRLAHDATIGASAEANKVSAAAQAAAENARVELERRRAAEAEASTRRSSEGASKAAQTGASGISMQAQADALAAQEREVVNATVNEASC